MKRLAVVAVLLGLLAPPAGAQGLQALSWTEVTDPAGRFALSMPGKVRNENTSYGNGGKGQRFIAEVADDEAYVFEFTDYPPALTENLAPTTMLRQAQAGTVGSFKGASITRERDIELGPWPGRAYALRLPNGLIYQARIFAAAKRLYQVIVVTSVPKATSPSINQYFESFRIIGQ
jgi:hypothetical protein